MRSKCHFPQPPTQGMARKFLFPQRPGASGAKIPATRGGGSRTPVALPAVAVIDAESIAGRQWDRRGQARRELQARLGFGRRNVLIEGRVVQCRLQITTKMAWP